MFYALSIHGHETFVLSRETKLEQYSQHRPSSNQSTRSRFPQVLNPTLCVTVVARACSTIALPPQDNRQFWTITKNKNMDERRGPPSSSDSHGIHSILHALLIVRSHRNQKRLLYADANAMIVERHHGPRTTVAQFYAVENPVVAVVQELDRDPPPAPPPRATAFSPIIVGDCRHIPYPELSACPSLTVEGDFGPGTAISVTPRLSPVGMDPLILVDDDPPRFASTKV